MIIVLPLGLIILIVVFIAFARFSTAINRRDAKRRSIPPSPSTHPLAKHRPLSSSNHPTR